VSPLLGDQPPRHRDDGLLAELAAPPPLEDSREALAYWRHRLHMLPLHRRAQRREARAMIVRWEERVRRAEVARMPVPLQWVVTGMHALRPVFIGIAAVIALVAVIWTALFIAAIAALT
jgi:hypothetical protein